jgi:hypothetical protein
MQRHKRGEAHYYPPGAREFCLACGAVRIWAIPGYKNSGWSLNGKPQMYCSGKQALKGKEDK